MKNIVLIGMSGVGKSSIGKNLAQALNFDFLDTDEIIELSHGKISRIFEEDGEETFRRLESDLIEKLMVTNSVIATGGGIVLDPLNRKKLRELGLVLYLDASEDKLIKNIESDSLNKRPLLEADLKGRLFSLNKERKPIYNLAADNRIKISDEDSINDVVDNIMEFLNNLL